MESTFIYLTDLIHKWLNISLVRYVNKKRRMKNSIPWKGKTKIRTKIKLIRFYQMWFAIQTEGNEIKKRLPRNVKKEERGVVKYQFEIHWWMFYRSFEIKCCYRFASNTCYAKFFTEKTIAVVQRITHLKGETKK